MTFYGEGEQGEHPFYSHIPRSVKKGLGTEKDVFEPNHDCPHDHMSVLEEKGYIKSLE
jgi:hypothetical protein